MVHGTHVWLRDLIPEKTEHIIERGADLLTKIYTFASQFTFIEMSQVYAVTYCWMDDKVLFSFRFIVISTS